MSGCISIKGVKTIDTGSEKARLALESHSLQIWDRQFLSTSRPESGPNYREYLRVEGMKEIKGDIKIELLECRLDKSLWHNGMSIVSVLSLSLIPFNSEYSCPIKMTVTEGSVTQYFYSEEKYTESFGILLSYFAIGTPAYLAANKYESITKMLNEVGK
jgi:hypothetical protein